MTGLPTCEEKLMTKDQRKKLKDAIREIREMYYQRISEEIKARPDKSYREISVEFGVSEGTVYTIARMNRLSRNNDGQPLLDGPTSVEDGENHGI
jgi:DNA-directed RNA polymerase specialized sigma24 family protein